jgi:2-polyprenyl-6-methoxyphenol hydroxylase-like FAD-dependent oxidoreductase
VKVSQKTARSAWTSILLEAPHTESRVGGREGTLSFVGSESARLDKMSGQGWMAIGDAAISFDPLSSHGLCSAIQQAADAAELLSACPPSDGLADFDSKRNSVLRVIRSNERPFIDEFASFQHIHFWRKRSM